MSKPSNQNSLFGLPVIVAALGYFVDIYDLLLFGIVRVPSLKDLGLNEQEVSAVGASIINWQMGGLLIGGILWGVLGDKRGRLSVLFGSIITYSIANILCGFIQDTSFLPATDLYKYLRFIAGIGLAGELGAGITLVSEILPKELRAIGTSLVAGIGLLGAVVAYFTVEIFGDWRIAYFVGGGLGFGLLLLRIGVIESGMFTEVSGQKNIAKGDFFSFFTNWERFVRYMKCIGIGLPTWFVIGILATFSNEFGKAFGIAEPIKPGLAIMWCYVGLAVGDLSSGFISHYFHSRKKAVAALMAFAGVFSIVYLFAGVKSSFALYSLCTLMGFGIGYWAMFVTIGAEQFGTNLRATAATTVPNMVRGMVIIMTTLFAGFKTGTLDVFGWFQLTVPQLGVIGAGTLVGVLSYFLGFYSTLTVPETHGKDLDFIEE
ncbi:MFS transporter [Runella sp.]|uniref:MFS transporter n=1 Tax=Runella sp. TaxID=1960881 RepID=UPI003D12CB5C